MAFLKTFLRSLKKIFKSPKATARRPHRKTTPRKAGKSSARKTATSASRPKSAKKKTHRSKSRSTSQSKAPRRVSSVKKISGKQIKQSHAQKIQPASQRAPGVLLGEITHYFSKIEVVVVKLTKGSLKVGDKIAIRGGERDFTQTVKSMQIESVDVRMASRGELVGLKTIKPAREGDQVYLL